MTKDQISAIAITIESQGQQRFFALVDSQGSINRSGSGRMADTKDDLFIGVIEEPVFQRIMTRVSEGLLKFVGREINLPDQKGIPCKLTLSYRVGALMHNTVVHYGHLSGYPMDVVQVVKVVFEETQPWYENQKAVSEKNSKT